MAQLTELLARNYFNMWSYDTACVQLYLGMLHVKIWPMMLHTIAHNNPLKNVGT